MISDNLPIFGSRRRSYLLIFATIQFLSMVGLSILSTGSEKSAALMLFLTSLSVAFSDVIVDSLMVIQARKDPRCGAEELNTFLFTMNAIGGLFGSITAAILTQNFEPRYCFFFSALIGLSIAISSYRLNESVENEGLEQAINQEGLWFNFRRNLNQMKEAMKVPEYNSVILYLVLTGFVVPSFGSFGYYFMMDVIGLSKFTYSMLTVLGFCCLLLGTQAYHKWFKEWEFRHLVFIDVAIDLFLAPL